MRGDSGGELSGKGEVGKAPPPLPSCLPSARCAGENEDTLPSVPVSVSVSRLSGTTSASVCSPSRASVSVDTLLVPVLLGTMGAAETRAPRPRPRPRPLPWPRPRDPRVRVPLPLPRPLPLPTLAPRPLALPPREAALPRPRARVVAAPRPAATFGYFGSKSAESVPTSSCASPDASSVPSLTSLPL